MKINSFRGEYSWLSNFFPCDVFGQKSLEHVFQAGKTIDAEWRAKILACKTPGAAKRMGRQAPLRKDWESKKDYIMLVCLREKFKHAELREKLLATGDAELVEGNDWGDTYWGVCNGVGQNKLGKMLMQVRSELKEGDI